MCFTYALNFERSGNTYIFPQIMYFVFNPKQTEWFFFYKKVLKMFVYLACMDQNHVQVNRNEGETLLSWITPSYSSLHRSLSAHTVWPPGVEAATQPGDALARQHSYLTVFMEADVSSCSARKRRLKSCSLSVTFGTGEHGVEAQLLPWWCCASHVKCSTATKPRVDVLGQQ